VAECQTKLEIPLILVTRVTVYGDGNAGPKTRLQSEFSTILPPLMGGIMTIRYPFAITNIRKPAIRKMYPILKRYNAAWSASINHRPLPDTLQIGDAGWNVAGMPTDDITSPFNNVTKALEVIPSKIKNPPFTLALTM
jgi:hypothetical protein